MRLYGQTDLTTSELPDSLEFKIVYQEGFVEVVIGLLITAFVVWLFWRTGGPVPRIIAFLAATAWIVAIVANKSQGGEVSLRVTADELVTQGNTGALFRTEQRIAAKDVLGMSYRSGGENDLYGLHVKLRWSERCILPRMSEEQCQQAIDRIGGKFPDIQTDGSAFSLFGDGLPLTTLGLSDVGTTKQSERDKSD